VFWRITDTPEQPNLNNALRIQLSLPMIPHVIAGVSRALILPIAVVSGAVIATYFEFFRPAA
jgi:hypothetical protein